MISVDLPHAGNGDLGTILAETRQGLIPAHLRIARGLGFFRPVIAVVPGEVEVLGRFGPTLGDGMLHQVRECASSQSCSMEYILEIEYTPREILRATQ